MNQMFEQMAEAITGGEWNACWKRRVLYQELAGSAHDFYMIDAKVEEVGRALRPAGSRTGSRCNRPKSAVREQKYLLAKLLLEKPDILLAGRADELSG